MQHTKAILFFRQKRAVVLLCRSCLLLLTGKAFLRAAVFQVIDIRMNYYRQLIFYADTERSVQLN